VLGRRNHYIIHNHTMETLSVAIKERKTNVVSSMDQKAKDRTLECAIMSSDVVSAKYLLNNGAVFTKYVMHRVICDSSISNGMIRFLCDEGALLKDGTKHTILHEALKYNGYERIKILLTRSDTKDMINTVNDDGNTPLMCGLQYRGSCLDRNIIKLLAKNGASLFVTNGNCTASMLIFKYFGKEFLEEVIKEQPTNIDTQAKTTNIKAQLTDSQTEIADLKDQLARAQDETNALKVQLTDVQRESAIMNDKYAAIQSHLLRAQAAISGFQFK